MSRGFTVLELLIVMMFILVLGGIALPYVASYRQKTYDQVASRNLRDALTAQEAFYTVGERYLDCVGKDCSSQLPGLRISDTIHLGFRAPEDAEVEVVGVSCSEKGTDSGRTFFRIIRISGSDQFTNISSEHPCSDEGVTSVLEYQ